MATNTLKIEDGMVDKIVAMDKIMIIILFIIILHDDVHGYIILLNSKMLVRVCTRLIV